jgi:hypothetical protein
MYANVFYILVNNSMLRLVSIYTHLNMKEEEAAAAAAAATL